MRDSEVKCAPNVIISKLKPEKFCKMRKTILVPPDGGYGWVIVFASALNNFFVIPLLQNFGMIFKDTFTKLGFTAAQGSLIITLNSAFGMLTGLINGPLLNNFGYRKISYLGATMLTLGVFLTTFANGFVGFIISYGLIASLGLGLTMSSYSLAINTYFKERKSKAIGLSMALTGLGPIVMPQVINLLMQYHTIQGVTLILCSICANSFVAASLLQPVKYHMKKKVIEREELSKIEEEREDEVDEDDDVIFEEPSKRFPLMRSYSQVERGANRYHRKDSVISINYEQEGAGIYGIDSALGGSVISLESIAPKRTSSVSGRPNNKIEWWTSEPSVNLESSYNLFEEKTRRHNSESTQDPVEKLPQNVYNELSVEKKPEKPRWKRILLRIVVFFDLTLLKDPIYCNIMIGMSLAVFAEINFSVLTPFILHDFNLNTPQIATFLSSLGVADITLRFLAPYIGDILKQPPRIMYMITLLALITTRFSLFIFEEYQYLLGVAVALGMAKGIRTVYMSLVIPTYVPLERLAAASGIQMMVNGICIIAGGPLIGVVRDITGSYRPCIAIMNCVTFTTFVMWSVEIVIRRLKKKKNDTKENTIPQNRTQS